MADCAAGAIAAFHDPPPFATDVGDHRLEFFPAGDDRRDAILAIIRGARRSLKLVFYIFAEDAISTLVRDELTAAAGRGVRVMLIIDRFGSSASEAFLAPLCDAGGAFRYANPRWTQRYLIRNHQKMILADDAVAIFGGFNIADDYFAPPEVNGWTDLAVRIEGPAVEGLVQWFGRLDRWTGDAGPHFREVRRAVREWDWSAGELRWLVGGPTRGISTWARCVSEDLAQGRRLDMLMAYFSPPFRLMGRIGRIARLGETRLVMAGKSDNAATIGAARSLYRYLLRRGARIWEFSPCKLHTKLIVLDDTVYIGSANFDMRSLYLNLEIMLQVKDAALAERMRGFISQHIAASEEITPALHARRATPWNRLRWWLGWALVSVVDYTVTRRLNLGL
ncbi:MAG TPA: phospholipase D-like domain-containing protein [Qipengyuania sp.]|nr:phospholipase D-like domain-containing protein [Qipengyuania sp.]